MRGLDPALLLLLSAEITGRGWPRKSMPTVPGRVLGIERKEEVPPLEPGTMIEPVAEADSSDSSRNTFVQDCARCSLCRCR